MERLRRNRQGNAIRQEPDLPPERLFPNSPTEPASEDDRKNWKGFCEIESEPAFFNVMLHEFGVRGIKVQEVFGLDAELLALLPQPVHGLIFLYQWREEDPSDQETKCSERVWFANQTIENACASVALLNIVNNVPDAKLGDSLELFKQSTQNLTPAARGNCIGDSDFIRKIHNSFARKMDMLDADLFLKGKATKKPTKTRKRLAPVDDDDVGFHFIAFVPVEGQVWKLDGLEKQPQMLGSYSTGDWLYLVKPFIESCISKYEEGQIQFSLLALVHDPILDLYQSLAANMKAVQGLSSRLEEVQPDWKGFVATTAGDEASVEHNLIVCANPDFGVDQAAVDDATMDTITQESIRSSCFSSLMTTRQKLIDQQADLRASISAEEVLSKTDKQRAADRRHDYGPLIQRWLRLLIQNGSLKALVEKAEQEGY
ncbi:MAG: hypothetical protein M1835_002140 [Candelina submexicana]|nr:MAG: hypothetical protein M1835_002140 [Candelina submexicana]